MKSERNLVSARFSVFSVQFVRILYNPGAVNAW
jgi:hypothetical protein